MFPERNPTTIPPKRHTRSGSNVRSLRMSPGAIEVERNLTQ